MPILSPSRLLPLLLLAATACHSIDVHSSYDEQTDFSQLHTFDWSSVPPQARTAIADTSLVDLIAAQLAAKGLQRAKDNPDLLVAVHRSIGGTLNTDGWGYTMNQGRVGHYSLQEGTLVIDLVDRKRKISVWRGVASGAFRSDLGPEERRVKLTELLGEMFADYPPKS